ncbi:tigger transposable element-derived protein 6-like [Hydra vulgaris]|uniref:tigger transposable element-derived protein 6-like n=1 Tax=Hydra vulgaris TaxID=6087 RepID=UPI001F5EB6B2|nr:tigger transposable element-derived protein 6-like [Hydra vulgaris]
MGKYVRKTKRQCWSERSMSSAIEAVRKKEMGLKKACKQFNVPRSTLQRRCRLNLNFVQASLKSLGSVKCVFSIKMENELVTHIKQMEAMLFGLTPQVLRKVAYQFAKLNNLHKRFSSKSEQAGANWFRGFLTRHPELSVRTPEPTSAARAQGFNQVSVGKFFDLLQALQEKHHFFPDRVYNVDETGITTVPNKPSKVVAIRGKKQVGCLTSAEHGQLVTVEICMSASGNFVPPLFVFPRVHMKSELMDAAPPSSIAVCHPSGWMQSDIFVTWFMHFVKYANPIKHDPVLLILDGHKTHTSNLKVINLARQNNVILLCLPPHCSHRLQPLDVAFMKPLMTYYAEEVENWLRNHPRRVVTTYQIAELFKNSYLRAASAITAVNGFVKTGIFPINRNVFTDNDFASALATDIPLQLLNKKIMLEDVPGQTLISPQQILDIAQNEDLLIELQASKVVTPVVNQVLTQSLNFSEPVVPLTVSNKNQYFPLTELSPIPKIITPRKKKSSAQGFTAVLTSSPYKYALEEKQNTKTIKVLLKENRKLLTEIKRAKEKKKSQRPKKDHASSKKLIKIKNPIKKTMLCA